MQEEMLYTLAWTTLSNGDNVLASGGARNVLHFINTTDRVAYLQYALKIKVKLRIQGLLFHPENCNILFCGTSDGEVRMCDIGKPAAPDYESEVKVLSIFTLQSEIFSLAFCSISNILLAGCNDGLRGWYIESTKDTDKQMDVLKFTLPLSEKNADTALVDSVEVLKGGIIATKCALQSSIYIWNLPTTVGNVKKLQTTDFTVAPTHVLHWSDTDNYFMYAGAHMGAGLLCCGDDVGALWLYDISNLDFFHTEIKPVVVEPTLIIPWPSLSDPNTERKRKLNLDVYDIVVDKVCIDSTGKHIVAVTNNNMVCIWERCN